jgi:GAF domain-containing protein
VTDSAPSSTSSQNRRELAALLAQLGAVVLSTETIGTTVELVTSLAVQTLPGTTGAGVTLVDARGKRSVAASNAIVERADRLQYELDDGPCLTASRDRVTVRIDDVTEERRWPSWTAAVRDVGVRSMLSVPLVAAGAGIGAIKVYSSQPSAYEARAEHVLELFARQAAILLANAQTLADARQMNLQLTDALRSRDVIGQAKGILMARGAVDDGTAFAMLVNASQQANMRLHAMARQLVDSVKGDNADRAERRPAD